MNQEIKQRWVAALRSGEYKQGEGMLKDANRFCCLGVLADIYLKDNEKSWTDRTQEPHWEEEHTESYDWFGTLPKAIREWAGLTANGDSFVAVAVPSELSPHEFPATLVGLNDQGVPFPEIADIIEQQL